MNRRSFMAAILAGGMAPAIVRASSLMPIFVRRESGLFVPGPAGNYYATPDSAALDITGDLDVMNGWFRVVGTGVDARSYFSSQHINTPFERIEWLPILPRDDIYRAEVKQGINGSIIRRLK